MLHKVIALDTYKKKLISDKELGFVPEPNYEFEVSDERLKVLLGNNGYHLTFVRLAEDVAEEKPKKRGRKKKE